MATIKQFADIHDLEIFLALCDERYFRYSEYGVTSIDDLLSKTLAEETYAKKEDVPNISGLISRSEVELRYLSQSAAQDLYATKSELENAVEGIDLSAYLTIDQANADFLTQEIADGLYMKIGEVPELTDYLTKKEAAAIYITEELADAKYMPIGGESGLDLTKYLLKTEAEDIYATKDELESIDVTSQLTDYLKKTEAEELYLTPQEAGDAYVSKADMPTEDFQDLATKTWVEENMSSDLSSDKITGILPFPKGGTGTSEPLDALASLLYGQNKPSGIYPLDRADPYIQYDNRSEWAALGFGIAYFTTYQDWMQKIPRAVTYNGSNNWRTYMPQNAFDNVEGDMKACFTVLTLPAMASAGKMGPGWAIDDTASFIQIAWLSVQRGQGDTIHNTRQYESNTAGFKNTLYYRTSTFSTSADLDMPSWEMIVTPTMMDIILENYVTRNALQTDYLSATQITGQINSVKNWVQDQNYMTYNDVTSMFQPTMESGIKAAITNLLYDYLEVS